jgi:transcriptional regulator with XRE-family HTH domain
MLSWSTIALSGAAQVGQATINRFERNDGSANAATVAAIQRALEVAGVEFLPDNGVRLKAVESVRQG